MVKKNIAQLYLTCQLCPFLDREALQTIIHLHIPKPPHMHVKCNAWVAPVHTPWPLRICVPPACALPQTCTPPASPPPSRTCTCAPHLRPSFCMHPHPVHVHSASPHAPCVCTCGPPYTPHPHTCTAVTQKPACHRRRMRMRSRTELG